MTTKTAPVRNTQKLQDLARRFERIEKLTREQGEALQIQFKRIAELQAEVDEMRARADNASDWTNRQKNSFEPVIAPSGGRIRLKSSSTQVSRIHRLPVRSKQ
jgi:hypothetical protein